MTRRVLITFYYFFLYIFNSWSFFKCCCYDFSFLFSLECGLSETCIPIRYYSAFFSLNGYMRVIGLEWLCSTVFWYFMYITVLWSLYSLLLRTLHHLKKCLLLFEITTLFSFFSWILVRVAFFSSNVRVRSRPAARLLLFKNHFCEVQ